MIVALVVLFSCTREKSCENCLQENQPPIAKAGPDQTFKLPKDSAWLDGSSSRDPDGRITEWVWTKIAGPSSVAIKDLFKAVTLAKNLITGTYSFELKVTDNAGLFTKDTVKIFIDSANAPNKAPVAKAGPDQVITLPVNMVMLDGTASTDPDNNIIGYAWRIISGPPSALFSDPVAIKPDVSNLTDGVYLFELTVTDATGLSSTDTVQIRVNISPNKSPIADAGKDITVTYNLQTCSLEPSFITLDGNLSRDPDGRIVTYEWSVIVAASASVVITNPASVVTTVSNLVPGTYSFKLRVTDNDGAFDDDTIVVNTVYSNRPAVNARLTLLKTLGDARKISVVVAAGNKILFAGGSSVPSGPGPSFTSTVDIYDITTNAWSTANLSIPRAGIAAAAMGNLVFFAGGTGVLPSGRVGLTSRVDIYDAVANTWSTMEMPHADDLLSAIVFGNKLIIAGGKFVDIYNTVTKRWITTNLSQSRYLMSTTNVRGGLYFAGGVTDKSSLNPTSRIDIYSPATDSWSTTELSKPKYGMSAIFANGKVLWAGGMSSNNMTNEVEMYDPLSGVTSFSCLFQPNSFSAFSSGILNNKVAFFVYNGKAKDRFDIYDPLSNSWSIGVLNQAVSASLIISANGSLYAAGSVGNNDVYHRQVWKLDF